MTLLALSNYLLWAKIPVWSSHICSEKDPSSWWQIGSRNLRSTNRPIKYPTATPYLWFFSLSTYLGKATIDQENNSRVESANVVFTLRVSYRHLLLFSSKPRWICIHCCIFVMNNMTTNDNSPSAALLEHPRVNYPFLVETLWPLHPRADDSPFLGKSMSQPPQLPIFPSQP